MNKILSFFSTTTGKIIIVIIVALIVTYIVHYFAIRRKYKGNTLDEVQNAIRKARATYYLGYLIENDPAVETMGLREVAFWHDNNREVTIVETDIQSGLSSLGLGSEFYDDFLPMVGEKVTLTDFVS